MWSFFAPKSLCLPYENNIHNSKFTSNPTPYKSTSSATILQFFNLIYFRGKQKNVVCYTASLSRMFTASAKIVKPDGSAPDEFEQSVSEALLELEVNSDMKAQLRDIYITGAKELDFGDRKKVIILFVPVPLLRNVQKVQVITLILILILPKIKKMCLDGITYLANTTKPDFSWMADKYYYGSWIEERENLILQI